MSDLLSFMTENGFSYLLASYSALDHFFRVKEPGTVFIHTEEPIEALAKAFDGLTFSGLPFEDAALEYGGCRYAFRCVDRMDEAGPSAFTAMKLLYDPRKKIFIDRQGIYPDLRNPDLVSDGLTALPVITLMEAAKMVSRYHYEYATDFRIQPRDAIDIKNEHQKDLLTGILLCRYPDKGLDLLYRAGFIEQYWPELQMMTDTKQAKDYHPEGNVWKHTLETFQYRKRVDLTLSLGQLLHDTGKPVSSGSADRPFNNHSENGVTIARKFLKRLGYPESLVQDVLFLVRYHMLPIGLTKLPLYKTEKIMDSPVFPLLLELYRADISSSFMGPDSYYEACRFYRNYISKKSRSFYLKHVKHYID